MTDLAPIVARLREALNRSRGFPVFSVQTEDLTALLDALEGKTARNTTMTDISKALAIETAEVWENMAEMELDARPGRRVTLRECADVLRMLADRPDHTVEQQDCPHTGSPLRYCEYRPDHVAVCPIGLPCRTFAEAQAHRANRGRS